MLDEIFAHCFAKEHGGLFKQMLEEKPQIKHWWTNILNAVRSVFQDAAKKNGVDLEGMRGLGTDTLKLTEHCIAMPVEQFLRNVIPNNPLPIN